MTRGAQDAFHISEVVVEFGLDARVQRRASLAQFAHVEIEQHGRHGGTFGKVHRLKVADVGGCASLGDHLGRIFGTEDFGDGGTLDDSLAVHLDHG